MSIVTDLRGNSEEKHLRRGEPSVREAEGTSGRDWREGGARRKVRDAAGRILGSKRH